MVRLEVGQGYNTDGNIKADNISLHSDRLRNLRALGHIKNLSPMPYVLGSYFFFGGGGI